MSELNLDEIREVVRYCHTKDRKCYKCLAGANLNKIKSCEKIVTIWLLQMADEIERLRKESVWSNAPIGANGAVIHYLHGGVEFEVVKSIIRKHPKSKDEIMVDDIISDLFSCSDDTHITNDVCRSMTQGELRDLLTKTIRKSKENDHD